MEKSISDKITDLVSQGETGKALNLLRDHVTTASPRNETLYHSVVMLLGKYNKFERAQRLGLEPEGKELNRIEYNLLRINEDLRTGKLAVASKNTRTTRKVSSTAKPQQKSSGSSPILWIFATLGGLVVLIILIAIMTYEEPEFSTPSDVSLESIEQAIREEEKRESAEFVETPPVSVEPTKELKDISNQVIKNLLAGSSWYDNTYGNGYINFDVAGKSATFLQGMGSIEVGAVAEDGYIYAIYLNPNGHTGYLRINPQMQGNNLSILVQNYLTGRFDTAPMIWSRQ